MLIGVMVLGGCLVGAGMLLAQRELYDSERIHFNNRVNFFQLYADKVDERLGHIEASLNRMLETVQEGRTDLPGEAVPKGPARVAPQYHARMEEINRLADEGLTFDQIAKKMKMNKGEVQLLRNLSRG